MGQVPMHECIQDQRIRDLTARVDKIEEKQYSTHETIKEIKNFQNKLVWLMLTTLLTSVGSLIMLVFTLIK